jgi:hypothetical protein
MTVLFRYACTVAALSSATVAAWAGRSNYTVTPGTDPNFAGKIQERNAPIPRFARDPTAAHDSSRRREWLKEALQTA